MAEIIPDYLRQPTVLEDHTERMKVLAAIVSILKEGDEKFSRHTVEFLMGELSRAQEMLTQAKNQERLIQVSPQDTRHLRTWLERPNGSLGGPRRLRVDAVEGGGLLIGVRPRRGDER